MWSQPQRRHQHKQQELTLASSLASLRTLLSIATILPSFVVASTSTQPLHSSSPSIRSNRQSAVFFASIRRVQAATDQQQQELQPAEAGGGDTKAAASWHHEYPIQTVKDDSNQDHYHQISIANDSIAVPNRNYPLLLSPGVDGASSSSGSGSNSNSAWKQQQPEHLQYPAIHSKLISPSIMSLGSYNHNITNDTDASSASKAASTTGLNLNVVYLGVFAALMVMVSGLFLLIIIPPLVRWCRRQCNAWIPVNPQRIERRYETVEGWLISKKVRAHDPLCDHFRESSIGGSVEYSLKLQKHNQTGISLASHIPRVESDQLSPTVLVQCDTIKESPSYDTADTVPACLSWDEDSENNDALDDDNASTGRECPICMEPFLVDQIVSWSISTHCQHVFHHACIKEWLLGHSDCPFCRQLCMPVDCPQIRAQIQRQQWRSMLRTASTTSSARTIATRKQHNDNGPPSATRRAVRASSSSNTQSEGDDDVFVQLSRRLWVRSATTYYCQEHGLVVLPAIVLPRSLQWLHTDRGTEQELGKVKIEAGRHLSLKAMYRDRLVARTLTESRILKEDLVHARAGCLDMNGQAKTATHQRRWWFGGLRWTAETITTTVQQQQQSAQDEESGLAPTNQIGSQVAVSAWDNNIIPAANNDRMSNIIVDTSTRSTTITTDASL